ncbi:hypothetical protein A2U01_0092273, partial [Trifolium medium]|nr:hypothetical protein [Trifolium medium]
RSDGGRAIRTQKHRTAYEPTTTTKSPSAIWTTVVRRTGTAHRTTTLLIYITLTRFGLG